MCVIVIFFNCTLVHAPGVMKIFFFFGEGGVMKTKKRDVY